MRISERWWTRRMVIGTLAAGRPARGEEAQIAWTGLQPSYAGLEEVKAWIVNQGTLPLFRSRWWPDYAARLARFEDGRGRCEAGAWPGRCGVVKQAAEPLALRPGERQEVPVNWSLSVSGEGGAMRFVNDDRVERPVPGRYRLMLWYAGEPWTVVHRPARPRMAVSPEFTVRDRAGGER